MEQFKKELQASCRFSAVLCCILAVFAALGFAAEAGLVGLTPVGADEHWQSMWRGMISGASVGILALMGFGLVRGLRALKDETKLKKLYVEAKDERQVMIYTAARSSAMQITLLGGLVAGMVISYFHMSIGLTIIALETIHAVVAFCCKVYYGRKF